jgi:sec-independent protein translocase protein TatC
MSLADHLRELRSRLIRSAIAVAIGTIGGWFLYQPILETLQQPLADIGAERQALVTLNFAGISDPFNLRLKLAFYLGVIVSSPVWLYQTWAFVVPGLTRREKRYALGFVTAAVPLFLAGIGLAWLVLPNALTFFSTLVPDDAAQAIDARDYLTFVTRMLLSFGIAFVIPLFLVALNLVGMLSARSMIKGWRLATFLSFLFAAMASPTPDAGTMIALALPMVGLYFGATGIAWLVDRKRARSRSDDPVFGISDDEASPLPPS